MDKRQKITPETSGAPVLPDAPTIPKTDAPTVGKEVKGAPVLRPFYTTKQAAELMGVSEKTMERIILQGQIDIIRAGAGVKRTRTLISNDALTDYMAARTVPAKAAPIHGQPPERSTTAKNKVKADTSFVHQVMNCFDTFRRLIDKYHADPVTCQGNDFKSGWQILVSYTGYFIRQASILEQAVRANAVKLGYAEPKPEPVKPVEPVHGQPPERSTTAGKGVKDAAPVPVMVPAKAATASPMKPVEPIHGKTEPAKGAPKSSTAPNRTRKEPESGKGGHTYNNEGGGTFMDNFYYDDEEE